MSKKRFVPSKYAGHTYDVKTDKHYYVTDEYVGCRELFDEIEMLENENEQLKSELRKWNEQEKQVDNEDVYKEAILTMLGILAENGLYFSGVKDE